MTKIHDNAIRNNLLKPNFLTATNVVQPADPTQETLMIVTLDKLRANALNPRVTKNPKFEEIKSSIYSRGLDQPPPITRRPGETFYMISDGGNTRLSILNELWQETREERFFKVYCLFKPWISDLHSLIGHLAENELRSDYTFIEKAVGVIKTREMYEAERRAQSNHKELSARELSELLKKDGYPVHYSLISRMQQTVEYLLPCIPELLYKGLGKPQIEKILSLRGNARQVWKKYQEPTLNRFDAAFEVMLSQFNHPDDEIRFELLEEEIAAMLCRELALDYNRVQLEMTSLVIPPKHQAPLVITEVAAPVIPDLSGVPSAPAAKSVLRHATSETKNPTAGRKEEQLIMPDLDETGKSSEKYYSNSENYSGEESEVFEYDNNDNVDAESDTVHDIERRATETSEPPLALQKVSPPTIHLSPLKAAPIPNSTIGGDIEPVSDIWLIHELFDNLDALSGATAMTGRLAYDIARIGGMHKRVYPVKNEAGFGVKPFEESESNAPFAFEIWQFLRFISGEVTEFTLSETLLLSGSDALIVKMMRLIRILRRIRELKNRVKGASQ